MGMAMKLILVIITLSLKSWISLYEGQAYEIYNAHNWHVGKLNNHVM